MTSRSREIAAGVHWLGMGRGITQSNVYFVRSGSSWVLIDAAWAHDAPMIERTAEALFGTNARPTAILLTHNHPDHAGAAVELAQLWSVPVYLHPDDLPLVAGNLAAAEAHPAGPLDRWIILPMMRILPRRARDRLAAQGAAFTAVAHAFDPDAGVPGLPDWECIPTPGHSPGHVAYFRRRDGVLITGDAIVTMNLNSVWDLLRNKQRLAAPPYITTWNWQAAKQSVAVLAQLEPTVVASGHGVPITAAAASQLRAFAAHFAGPHKPEGARDGGKLILASPSRADWLLFALSAAGAPTGIVLLSRFGRLGGLLMEVAGTALGIRAGTMIAQGAPRRLQGLPRLLLFTETAVDALASLAGFWAWVWQPFVRPVLRHRLAAVGRRQRRAWTRHPVGKTDTSWVGRLATTAWMAAMVMHTVRMAIYISPGRGRRNEHALSGHGEKGQRKMAHVEGQIIIDRPVEAVFDFVADERNEPRYNPQMRCAEQTSTGPIGVGTTFRAEITSMGRPVAMTIAYTEYQRPQRLMSSTHLSSMDIQGTLTFEPVPAGTRMRWSWELKPRGIFKLMTPVVARIGRRQEEMIWTGLKRCLEAQPATQAQC